MIKGSSGSAKLFAAYKKKCRLRSIPFELSYQDFIQLAVSHCYLCGAPPAQINKQYQKGKTHTFTYNGIDRVNNKLGYVMGNVMPCCGRCNSIKSSFDLTNLFKHLQKIMKNLRKLT